MNINILKTLFIFKRIGLFLMILLFQKMKAQNTDTFIYTPFYPINFDYKQSDVYISSKDSVYLKKFIGYIIDSTYFLRNGYFVIETFSTKNELDSNPCIDFRRFSMLQQHMMNLINERLPFPKVYSVYIYSKTFLNSYTPLTYEQPYCMISMQLHPNYNRFKLFKRN